MTFSLGNHSFGLRTTLIVFLISLVSVLSAQTEVEEKLALQFFQNQEYEQAAELYQKIYSAKPTPFYYNYYLDCLFALKDYKKAKSFVHSVARKNPGEIKYQVDEIYCDERSGKIEKANKAYEKLIKKSKKEREECLALADAFIVRNHNDYALSTMLRAEKSISNPPLNLEIAELYSKMGNYQAMVEKYLDMAVIDDKYIDAVKSKLQGIITDPNENTVSEILKNELLKRTQKHPNQTIYSEFLYWYSIQKKEWQLALIQAKALDRQFNEQGERVFSLASILMSNQSYDLATEAYNYIIGLGSDSPYFTASQMSVLEARFKKITSQKIYNQKELEELEKAYNKKLEAYGHNSSTAQMMMNLAYLQAFYLDKMESAKSLLESVIDIPNLNTSIRAKAKLELADMKLFSGEKWSASLIYKQVEKAHKNDAIGFEAKFKAAKFFYYVGEMEWAKAQLKVLSGATAKLIANDAMELYLLISENISDDSTYDALQIYARADLFSFQKKYIEANLTLDTLLNVFPNHNIIDDVYFKKASIAMDTKDYKLADTLYSQCISQNPMGPKADNSLIARARLYDYTFNDKKKAIDFYKKILLDYPGSLFTIEARKRYRELEGE
jgi:tetratricopeptide (TPR) repeat protein